MLFSFQSHKNNEKERGVLYRQFMTVGLLLLLLLLVVLVTDLLNFVLLGFIFRVLISCHPVEITLRKRQPPVSHLVELISCVYSPLQPEFYV